jgi:CheY-like chemotaxis protein
VTKPQLLIIDDDQNVRNALRAGFAKIGVEVTGASDGKQGLALLREGRFDLMLLDILMPVMDGLEMLRTLRAKPIVGGKDVPVMLLTNLAEYDPKIKDMQAMGAIGVIIKAENQVSEIVERVQGVLAARAGGKGA